MDERKEGWYWVSEHEPPHDSWEPVWFDREGFHVGGRERWGSSDFGLIGPRSPTPDEPWQCVPNTLNNEMVKAFILETVGRWDNVTEAERVEVAEKLQSAFDAILSAAPKPGEEN